MAATPKTAGLPPRPSALPAAPAASALPPAGNLGGGSGPTSPPAQPPKMATVKQSPFRFLPFIVGALLLAGLVYFVFTRLFGGGGGTSTTTTPQVRKGNQVTITYWGLWEDSAIMQDVIDDFEKANPTIKVSYQKQSYQDYRERLQTAIVSGRGPDVFRFHASWVPMLAQELSAVPSNVFTQPQFESTFYPVAQQQLLVGNELAGIPVMYDGLGLYYNEEIFRTANVQPPTTWAEVQALASELTIRSGNSIQRGGIALGNASNVEHFSDIIGLLMLQNGADPADPTSKAAQEAMLFYTNFVRSARVWDDTLPSSTVAFARGDVAMMIAPSWRAHDVKALNPNLKFGIAPVPQLSTKKITWGTYWAEGVSAQSKNKDAAWTFLKYLSSAEAMKKFYSTASQTRPFGEIYSRQDLASEVAGNPLVAPYLQDAPYAQNWYLNSFTHDNGINDLLIKYYEDAVTAIVAGKDVESSMATVGQGTSQVLRQYGLQAPSTGAVAQ